MSDTAKEDVKLSLKVMINKEKTKVLFAEVDNDFADVLLRFLSLPLGRIVKLLENHYSDKAPVLGSITSLYKSIANLDDSHFSTAAAKQMLLDPKSSLDSICCKLKLDISDSHPTKFFTCDNCSLPHVFMHFGGGRACACGGQMDSEIEVHYWKRKAGGGFTLHNACFMVSEALRMIPYSNGFFQALSSLSISDADIGAELRNITVGTDEIMDLLRCSLLSKTPLTDFILNNREINSWSTKPEPEYFFHQIEKKEEEASNSKKSIILKVTVQKSTTKVLFAKAKEDFIDLLSTFLILPISAVETLLESNTCLNNIDNLYKTTSDVILDKYFIALDTKKKLMNPNLPHLYKPNITILPLKEEPAPWLQYDHAFNIDGREVLIFSDNSGYFSLNHFKSPKDNRNYVVGPTIFMVTDDLTVTPFCTSTSFSILSRLNIPFSDVEELEFPISLQEGLSILKASLTSDSALTHGLIRHKMKKKPGKIGF